jgi:hypothetical protein
VCLVGMLLSPTRDGLAHLSAPPLRVSGLAPSAVFPVLGAAAVVAPRCQSIAGGRSQPKLGARTLNPARSTSLGVEYDRHDSGSGALARRRTPD